MKLALSDTSNFKVLKALHGSIPNKFLLLDSTKKWNTQTFVLKGVDLANPKVKYQMDSGTYKKYNDMYSNSYSDPYHQTYLFTDKVLQQKISPSEQIKLQLRAAKLKAQKIKIDGQNCHTIQDYKQVKSGYFLQVTEPVFTTDKHYAFISFDVFKQDPELEQETVNQCYYGDVTIVYEKQRKNTWKRIKLKDRFIL